MVPPGIYTTTQVARRLGVSTRTLYRWLEQRGFPKPKAVKAGKAKLWTWTATDIKKAQQFLRKRQETISRVLDELTRVRRGPKFVSLAMDEALLTKEELAGRLKVPVSWVYEQTRARAGVRNDDPFPYQKTGRYLRFAWSEVVDWMNRRQQERRQSK